MAKDDKTATAPKKDTKESKDASEGWNTVHAEEAKATQSSGTAAIEVTIRPGKFIAEKTIDGHLITAVGETQEQLDAAIESQQASLDSAPASSTAPPVASDAAGGEDGEGLGGVLPELKVDRDEEGQVQEVKA